MRLISLATGVALAITSSLAMAQNAPSANRPAGAPAAKPAPAQAANAPAAGTHYNTSATNVGTLLGDPAAKAVLAKHIPNIVNSPNIEQGSAMTLKDMQQYSPDQLSDKILADIDADLAKLPVKK
jgi:hypothetical protein